MMDMNQSPESEDTTQLSPEEINKTRETDTGSQSRDDQGLQFKELEHFKETPLSLEEQNGMNNYNNPGDEFKTGHWAIDFHAAEKAQLFEPAPRQSAVNSDFVETIPPETPVSQPVPEVVLPETVGEVDSQATTLNPVAFTPAETEAPQETQPTIITPRKKQVTTTAKPPSKPVSGKTQPTLVGGQPPIQPRKTKKKKGCFSRGILIALIVLLLILLGVGIYAISKYFEIASTLPSVDELQNRASQFETTYILDRNGNILYEIVDPNAGKRTYVPLERISPYLIAATIATEDKEYYNHPGFDLIALARALYTNYTSGEIVSGASTITQQLARLLLLTDERYDQTYERKAREIILAAEITRRYTKEQVLELYLNEIFYGNLSYGIEAGANTYFNTTAAELNLFQSAFLAGIPQTPAVYDIYSNREETLNRAKTVLVLMYELSNETGCIHIGENLEPVCVDAIQTIAASDALDAYEFQKRDINMQFPHWVVFIQSLLENQFDAQTIYRSGFSIYTTLDPDMQREAEQAVTNQLAQMTGKNATNGAVVVMNPTNGEILSMVGSADFNNEAISGQVNMALTQTRQPGSSIKPLTYLAAFEKDWTPSTLIWDVPTKFRPSTDPFDTSPDYEPVNYDGRFHGPVLVRDALANSFNIPAVKALEYVGIYDDPNTAEQDGFINFAHRLGITSLNRPDYGLSLTLGGGEVSLLEMTGAFQVIANEGRKIAPVAITKVVDHQGNVLFEYQPPAGDQVVRSAHAYLISSILSDPVARAPMFGYDSVLNLPFPAAAKTGTTNDFRDNWTLGYTPDLVVGVWVGNADYSPMVNTTGVEGAAPIWAEIMQAGINRYKGGVATPFARPSDVVDYTICTVSGAQPSEYCPTYKTEIFASDQIPLPKDQDLWLKTSIDAWTNLQASPACAEFTKEALAINVEDKSAIEWLRTQPGRDWANNNGFPDPLVVKPERECRLDDPRPIIDLIGVSDNAVIRENPFVIAGVIDATANFKQFKIHWGKGPDPTEWHELTPDWITSPITSASEILKWDMTDVDVDVITLRVTMHSTINTEVQKKWVLRLDLPTPTPTLTPTATMTPTVTPTLPPEPTATPTPPPDESTPAP
ncbi:MAG: transglycosylase domain-containing protein [Anaerolineaceae bacterium]